MGRDSLIRPEHIDNLIIEVHDSLQANPLMVTDEGYDQFAEFMWQRFDKYFSDLIGDYNYN